MAEGQGFEPWDACTSTVFKGVDVPQGNQLKPTRTVKKRGFGPLPNRSETGRFRQDSGHNLGTVRGCSTWRLIHRPAAGGSSWRGCAAGLSLAEFAERDVTRCGFLSRTVLSDKVSCHRCRDHARDVVFRDTRRSRLRGADARGLPGARHGCAHPVSRRDRESPLLLPRRGRHRPLDGSQRRPPRVPTSRGDHLYRRLSPARRRR